MEKRQKVLAANARSVESGLERLGQHIEADYIANTALLKEYAAVVGTLQPDYKSIAQLLAKDATKDGPLYKSLQTRVKDARTDIATAVQSKQLTDSLNNEFSALHEATKPGNYGMVITDPINVLADMSGGLLARVESLKKEASQQQNKADDFGVGSQLVGNPTYGSWQSHSNGSSFWVYYGQYRMFSDVFRGGRPTYYDNWSQRRDYSAYHDRGRSYYTSPKQQAAQASVQTQAKKKFAASGKTFKSPYAASKKSSTRAPSPIRAPSKFKSSYARSSYSGSSGAATVAAVGTKKISRWGSYNSKNMSGGGRSSSGGK